MEARSAKIEVSRLKGRGFLRDGGYCEKVEQQVEVAEFVETKMAVPRTALEDQIKVHFRHVRFAMQIGNPRVNIR